jgi:hypothetical protein
MHFCNNVGLACLMFCLIGYNQSMKSKNWSFARGIDSFFANLAVFAIGFVWARSHRASLSISLYIACFGTLCCWAIFRLRDREKRTNQLTKTQQLHMQECINQLMLNLPETNLDFFEKVLTAKFGTVDRLEDCLVVRHNGVATAVFVAIHPNKLSETEVCKCFGRSNSMHLDKMLILTAHGNTPSGKQLVAHLPDIKTTIYNDVDVYKMLTAFGTYPDINIKLKKAAKISKVNLLTIALSPKNTVKYLMLSFVFVLYSYFFGGTVYYLVFASIALALALASKLNIAQ